MSYKNQSGRGAGTEPILIEVPAECKSLVHAIQAFMAKTVEVVRSTRGTRAVDYAEVETSLAAEAANVEREGHAAVLAALEVDAPKLLINGERYSRIGHATGTYQTLAGSVDLPRAIYRKDGERNARIVDAISLRTGAYERGWLPRTAQAIAFAVQAGTSRDAHAHAQQIGRLPYARASFERVAHAVGENWIREHAEIEDAVIEAFEVPANCHAVSVALDRVSVPMEEPRKRPPGRPRANAPKRPIERNYRMAYCGTVTLHDSDGNSLRTFRFGCMPESDPALLCQDMAGHVFRILEHRPDLKIKLLADGAAEMWNLLEDTFNTGMFGNVERGIDFWHALEKLAPAAKVLAGPKGAGALLRRWRALLRRSSRAAARILKELEDSGLEYRWYNQEQPVHAAMTYLENNMDRMDYAAAIRNHLPIGSGNVEATCKTLVSVRMKRSGSRWKTRTGEHIIRLRAVALSDNWTEAMKRLHATRRRAVRRSA